MSASNHRRLECFATVCPGADQITHQSSASLAFVRGIHWWPVDSSHKLPIRRKMFPFGDVIMAMHDHRWSVPSRLSRWNRSGCGCDMKFNRQKLFKKAPKAWILNPDPENTRLYTNIIIKSKSGCMYISAESGSGFHQDVGIHVNFVKMDFIKMSNLSMFTHSFIAKWRIRNWYNRLSEVSSDTGPLHSAILNSRIRIRFKKIRPKRTAGFWNRASIQ